MKISEQQNARRDEFEPLGVASFVWYATMRIIALQIRNNEWTCHFFFLFLLIIYIYLSERVMAGDFFPQDYKEFPFKEGDLLASQRDDGKYAVNKILRIDKVVLKVGDSISIQGQPFTAPVEDFLLIISAAYGHAEFDSLEEAKQAAEKGNWNVSVGHAPNRPPGAAAGQILIGHMPVPEEELVGYHQWKEAFDKGEAGVF